MSLSEPSAVPGVEKLSWMLLSLGTLVQERRGKPGAWRNGRGGESRVLATGILDFVWEAFVK